MKHHILIVDDEPAVSDLLAYNLRKEHYDVDIAADGRKALHLALQSLPSASPIAASEPDSFFIATVRSCAIIFSFDFIYKQTD